MRLIYAKPFNKNNRLGCVQILCTTRYDVYLYVLYVYLYAHVSFCEYLRSMYYCTRPPFTVSCVLFPQF